MLGNHVISGAGKMCCSENLWQPQPCVIQEEASGKKQCQIAPVLLLPVPPCSVEYFKKTVLINAFNNCLNCCCAFCHKWFMNNHQFILLITLTSSMYYSEQRITIYLTAFGRKICCVPQLYKEH